MTGGTALLRAVGLRRRYGSRLVVDVTELTLDRGETLAVLGPNGAGKSTLFRLLLLLDRPDAGHVELDGRPVAPGSPDARRRLAGVFQKPYLFAGNVASNVGYGLGPRGVPAAERERRVEAALEAVSLRGREHSDVRELSGGEAQRVAIARALVLRPDVLLLDEPTSALDVTQRQRFRAQLQRLIRESSGAAVLITHDPADAFALADRVAVMEGGRLAQTGTPDRIVLEPATPFVAAMTGAELLLEGTVRGREAESLVEVELASGARVLALASEPRDWADLGAAARVVYRPEDVTLALSGSAQDTSARNRFTLHVSGLVPAGGLVRARLEGEVALSALLTRTSAEALGLAPGTRVEAQIKAVALRAFPSAAQDGFDRGGIR